MDADQQQYIQRAGLIQVLNQQGIDDLFLLDFNTASRHFVDVVRAINELQRAQMSAEEEAEIPVVLLELDEEEREEELAVMELTVSARILGDRESLDEEQNGSPIWLYDKAFRLSMRLRDQDCHQQHGDQEHGRYSENRRRAVPFSDSNVAHLSAAVLYNTGLTHHLRGLYSTNGRARDYARSLQLYQISLSLLGIVRQENIESCRVLVLAIYNNMADIYLHLLDVASYRECINLLRQVILAGQVTPEDVDFEVNIFLADQHESPNASSA